MLFNRKVFIKIAKYTTVYLKRQYTLDTRFGACLVFATDCVCNRLCLRWFDLIDRATRFFLRPPSRVFTMVTFEKGKFLESFMNNLSQGFQLPLGIKFPRQQCRRGHLWKTPFNNKIYENEISTSIFFFHSSLDFLNFYINRGHEFLCFWSAAGSA